MTPRQPIRTGALAATLLTLTALSGCVMDAPGPGGRFAARPTGIEGNWRNSEGLYNASFYNQSFRWSDVDSGALLVNGTYQKTSPTDYSLTMVSASTGQIKRANCRMSSSRLSCTREDGVQFVLVRVG